MRLWYDFFQSLYNTPIRAFQVVLQLHYSTSLQGVVFVKLPLAGIAPAWFGLFFGEPEE